METEYDGPLWPEAEKAYLEASKHNLDDWANTPLEWKQRIAVWVEPKKIIRISFTMQESQQEILDILYGVVDKHRDITYSAQQLEEYKVNEIKWGALK